MGRPSAGVDWIPGFPLGSGTVQGGEYTLFVGRPKQDDHVRLFRAPLIERHGAIRAEPGRRSSWQRAVYSNRNATPAGMAKER
jgi:hypothetical protein